MTIGASSLNPLGLGRSQPREPISATRPPTTNDISPEYDIGQPWVDTSTNIVYFLTNVFGGSTWTPVASASGNVDTLSGDSGTATPSSGDIGILGGTNLTSAAAGSDVTINMDAAITLATSVTSPVYTSGAGVDMSILAPTGQDIEVTLGDASAANKISWLDTGASEVASLDSDGTFTAVELDGIIGANTPAAGTFTTVVASTSVQAPIYTTGAGADTNINSATGQDIIVQMGDASAANKVSFEDSASAEVASIDSDGKAIFVQVTSPIYTVGAGADLNVNSASGQDVIVQMGDASAANKVSFADSGSAEVASIDSDGGAIFTSVVSPLYTSGAGADTAITAVAGQDINITMGDASAANKISFIDTGAAEVASLDSNGAMSALSYATSAATAGLTISGSDIDADGSDSNISITVSPKGTGDFVVDVGDIHNTAGDILAFRSSASGDVTIECTNSDNTMTDSDAFFEVAVGGTSGGNPGIRFQISGGQNYSMGIDNASASDDLLICGDNDIGTDPLVTIAEAGDVTVNKGNLILGAVATQLQMNGGAVTDFIGQATLSSGAATVLNTNIAATDRIFAFRADPNSSSALGIISVTAQTASTSFVITSLDPADGSTTVTGDTSIVNYIIVRQN